MRQVFIQHDGRRHVYKMIERVYLGVGGDPDKRVQRRIVLGYANSPVDLVDTFGADGERGFVLDDEMEVMH